jgi:hypothetical protein
LDVGATTVEGVGMGAFEKASWVGLGGRYGS